MIYQYSTNWLNTEIIYSSLQNDKIISKRQKVRFPLHFKQNLFKIIIFHILALGMFTHSS